MKNSISVLAIDDGSFKPKSRGKTVLIGVVFRIDGRIDGILKEDVGIDALDSTKQIIKMCNKSKFKDQIKYILLDGIAVAGFNVVDVETLFKKTGKPVINVFRKMPRLNLIEVALNNFKDKPKRLSLIKKAEDIYSFKNIFFQCHGITPNKAKILLKKTIFYSGLPEPIRIAHLIASAVTTGESTRP
ncbi:MAG: hypothetical protein CL943_00980 [Candidatus Diapherotrites archaeon]|uniref:UPF0215 protein CL943_00980 n=1 Tax=Candidatus Iainarchaeum sp. TaxID=3101447 RepID=A0A2D6M0A6_9ARCH|nr:hypothetical protein [Candidatus Diapherotrites archaeon]